MVLSRSASSAILAAWLIASADGQELARTPTEPAAIRISAAGTVADQSGRPIVGAEVALREAANARFLEEPWAPPANDVLATARTDEEGRFQFGNVAARPFQYSHDGDNRSTPWDIVVQAKGFGMAWKNLSRIDESGILKFRLERQARVRGRVVDNQLRPVVGAVIRVDGFAGLPGERDGSGRLPRAYSLSRSRLAITTSSDSDGWFDVAGLPPDRVVVLSVKHIDFAQQALYAATCDGPQPDLDPLVWGNEEPNLPASGKVLTGELQMPLAAGRRLAGRILYADTGQPGAGARVLLGSHLRGSQAIADNDGRFSFTSLSGNSFLLTVEPAPGSQFLGRRVTVAFAANQVANELEVRLTGGEEIAGEVIDDSTGRGVAGATVLFEPDASADTREGLLPQESQSDERGQFRIFVPPGSGKLWVLGPVPHYDLPSRSFLRIAARSFRRRNVQVRPQQEGASVIVSASGGGPDPKTFARFFQNVQVQAERPVSGLTFRIGRGLIIHGTASDEDGNPSPGVEIVMKSGGPLRNEPQPADIVYNADGAGRFLLDGLPLNSGQVLRFSDRRRKLVYSADIRAPRTDEPSVNMEMNVVLAPAGGIRGQVVVGGKPAPGARVELYSAPRAGSGAWMSLAVRRYHFDTAEADDEGRFQFDSVSAGSYVLQVDARDALRERSGEVVVAAGETAELEPLKLVPLDRSVSGIVVDRDDKPVEGAEIGVSVTVKHPGGGQATTSILPRGPGRVRTDRHGRFNFDGVPAMPLSILVHDPSGAEAGPRSRVGAISVEGGATDVKIVVKRRFD